MWFDSKVPFVIHNETILYKHSLYKIEYISMSWKDHIQSVCKRTKQKLTWGKLGIFCFIEKCLCLRLFFSFVINKCLSITLKIKLFHQIRICSNIDLKHFY